MKQPDTSLTAPSALPASQVLIAGGIVLLGAVLFSTKAIIVKLALPLGVDPVSLLLLRLIFSLPFYLAIFFWIRFGQTTSIRIGPYWLKIFLLGFVGYYLASYFDFWGLTFINASLERVILYAYPTLVLILSAVFLKKRITAHQVVAVGLCYAGIFIAVIFGKEQVVGQQVWLGTTLIFLSALSYAIYLIGCGQLIPKLGVWLFTSCAMMVSAACVLIHHLVVHPTLNLLGFPAGVYGYALLMAIVATVIPSLLISEGIKRIGASNAAIIGGVGPISTILLAALILNESFTVPQMLGTFLVICGVIYISVNMKQSKSPGQNRKFD